MKTKDIQIGKYYELKIWEDDGPFILECIDNEDGYFVMDSPDLELPMLISDDDDSEFDGLKEIPKEKYDIHFMGQLIEDAIINAVKKLSELN